MFNCVVSGNKLVDELHAGWMEQCYYKKDGLYFSVDDATDAINEEEVKRNLNAHLTRVSGFFGIDDLCLWNKDETLKLGRTKAEMLEQLSARLAVCNEEIELKGYYSQNTNHWCFALPAGYGDSKMRITAITNHGKKNLFQRRNLKIQLFTLKERTNILLISCVQIT